MHRSIRAGTSAFVERFLAAFDHRWPTADDLEFLAPDVRFIERPNLMNPRGSERDARSLSAAIEQGRHLLAWQSYEVRDHVASGETVVTRMRWSGDGATPRRRYRSTSGRTSTAPPIRAAGIRAASSSARSRLSASSR